MMGRVSSWVVVVFLVSSVSAQPPPVSPEAARLFGAAQAGNVDEVSAALDDVDVNERTPDGATALHLAVQAKQIEVVRLLLDRGADAMLRDVRNVVPLHLTAMTDDAETARLLVAAGTPVDVKGFTTRDGAAESTPLILAAELGSLSVARFLVEGGADVNYVNTFQRTALFWAKKAGKTEMAAFLEEHGASADPDEARQRSTSSSAGSSPPGEGDSGAGDSGDGASGSGETSEGSSPPDGDGSEPGGSSSPPNEGTSPDPGDGGVPISSPDVVTSNAEGGSDGIPPLEGAEPPSPPPVAEVSSTALAKPKRHLTIEELNEKLRREPKNGRVWRALGVAHLEAGDLPNARKAFEGAVAVDGRDVKARSRLCVVLKRLGDREAMKAEFHAVKAIDGEAAVKLKNALSKTR